MEKNNEIKKEVLDNADARFQHYGFNKTTMIEIARDCNMSAGNLYRYFKSKDDIITDIAVRWFCEREKLLKETIDNNKKKRVAALLESFVLINLQYSHDLFSGQKHIYELIQFITDKRTELLNNHLNKIELLIKEILDKGNNTGEFEVSNTETASEAVLNATVKFFAPHFMSLYPLNELECSAKKVVQLLITGLKKR